MRLLLTEDDPHLGELMAQGLRRAGWSVDTVASWADAEAALGVVSYQTLVLDLGLPDGDGLALLRDLRRRGDALPVLVTTARGRISDRVLGLNAGADDYLVKPFAMDELVARLGAILRRAAGPPRAVYRLGNLAVDPASRMVTIGDTLHSFPRRELTVLEWLVRASPRVVQKSTLEEALGSFDRDIGANAIEVYVMRLRKRLAQLGTDVGIRTERGQGYRLVHEKLP
ncbi:winged helix family two component transcriptional regulator [Humitalea rosea]|uniref:Winged helix family two component transcriptional regulator n=1 Tax=Humitalea rosea TaxID=990373 RepID=A0A2W7INL5_9PROT|nr:response regulator transcription factor [Humitalea rosea]PZW48644.1 winged helix family two component transcriptional regulator [Humitalea rosea]